MNNESSNDSLNFISSKSKCIKTACKSPVLETENRTLKVIYLLVNGHEEQLEFYAEDKTEDVKELLRVAAEASHTDILKLYNQYGSLIKIHPSMNCNTPFTRYSIEKISANTNNDLHLEFEIHDILNKIDKINVRTTTNQCHYQSSVCNIRSRLSNLSEKLSQLNYCYKLGIYKDMKKESNEGKTIIFRNLLYYKTDKNIQETFDKYDEISYLPICMDRLRELRKATFVNWKYTDYQLMNLVRYMFVDFDFFEKFKIEVDIFHDWLKQIYLHYHYVPFHNFKHCFCVAQMIFALIHLTDLKNCMTDVDIFSLIISGICHDLDHHGFSNTYMINVGSELALTYNDKSPLENHHCSVAFQILSDKRFNIIRNVSLQTFIAIRKGMIRCILDTDLSKHDALCKEFKSMIIDFDIKNEEHKNMLMSMIIKVSDISNEVRPIESSIKWMDCLFTEYFEQSNQEKLQGMPLTPYMDRENVFKPSAQVSFITFILLPLLRLVGEIFPQIYDEIIGPTERNLEYYTQLQNSHYEQARKKKICGLKT